ncbi:MAG: LLM class flavin-dependent oxidoreductase [Candidatus Hodarchaeales archaeon]|jgi:alkanesulfonate monooxygenase SsuD/methylene tetrahydromethanopterin reductase-like flavin-dependent oxidoreductase (luciferase family)
MNTQKKLGFTLSYDFLPPSLCHDLISLLDNSNFTHLFIPEAWGHDAFVQVAAMSHYTSELILGTGIVNLYSRTPATLAQTAASLFELTEGRFILGLGLSGPIVIQNWHGINYYQPSPIQRTREYLEVLRLIFSGERVDYDSETIFSLKGFKIRSFETPLEIPLYLAAIGSKNVQIAGEFADGWFPIWTSFTEILSSKEDLNQGLTKRKTKTGKQEELVIAPYILTLASDSDKAKSLIQRNLAYYIGGMGTFYFNIAERFGFEKEANKIKSAFQTGNRELAAKSVSQDMLDRIAVVGTPEYVLARYEELKQLGTSLPVVMLPHNCTAELAMDTIGAFQ